MGQIKEKYWFKVGDVVKVNRGISTASCTYAGRITRIRSVDNGNNTADIECDSLGGGVHTNELELYDEPWDK